ncbi:MAG: PQQ-dependent sugar dehydrogenase [Spirochaeta sp.]
MRIKTVMSIGLICIATAACGSAAAEANDLPPQTDSGVDFTVETIVDGLEHPWGMVFLPNGTDILVTERPGRLRLIQDGELLSQPISGLPEVSTSGQGGLLDITIDPEFDSNRLVYFTYSKPGENGATTAAARGELEDHQLTNVEDLFIAEAWGTAGRHFGSRIIIHDGYLYISVGDRGQMDEAQNTDNHNGTTVRLHTDGTIPEDNPFVDDPDVLDEIYSYGHRNVQGMTVHPETGDIWQSEHGPKGGDEINILRAGGNYGWPEYRGGDHYDGTPIPDYDVSGDIEIPLMHWTPSIAPGGITIYDGDVFSEWRGDLFVSALAHEHLQRVRFSGTEPVEIEQLLTDRGDRIRDVKTGPDGYIYVLVDDADAPMLRLVPAD